MYLLDSCTVSDFMKGEINTVRKIKSLSPSLVFISTITQVEIKYGLLRKFDNSHKYFKIFEEFSNSVTILSFDEETADYSAKIMAELSKKGLPIGAYDALIGGTAMKSGLILVTSNEKEFRRIGQINMENWRNN